MSIKRLAALTALALFAQTAFAQEYRLEICVQSGSSSWNCEDGANPPSVNAGEAVTLRVRAQERSGGSWAAYNPSGGSLPVSYSLSSHSTARMWREITPDGIPRSPLESTDNLLTTQTYTVYFTRVGDESISAAGSYGTIPLLGGLQLTVKAGAPARVAFIFPVPKNHGQSPTNISGSYDVEVQVQDKFGNPVSTAVPVTVSSQFPDKVNFDAPAASTDPADGTARFTAQEKNAMSGDVVDIYAAIGTGGKTSDTASLRVGRAANGLRVFYYQSSVAKHGDSTGTNKGGYWRDDYDEVEEIFAQVGGEWQQVWVKVRCPDGDTIMTELHTAARKAYVCVQASDPNIKFSKSPNGADAVKGEFADTVKGGFVTFWIQSDVPVEGASMTVTAKISPNCGGVNDNSIVSSRRGNITFVAMPEGVLTPSRNIPQIMPKTEETAIIAPITVLSGEFTAGPNPVSKQSGIVNFYRQGRRVAACELYIYDATGNIINKIKISDKALNTQARRIVGKWDLTDRKGRQVSEGTYLVKGVLKTSDGKSEKVSVILGVR